MEEDKLLEQTTRVALAGRALAGGMDKEYFDQAQSKTNDVLKKHLLPHTYYDYCIKGRGKRPNTRYALGLAKESIKYRALNKLIGKNND